MNDKISLLMLTCEGYLDISKLTMSEFIKHSNGLNIKKYLVSNSIDDYEIFKDLEVEVIDSEVQFGDGGQHFAKTLLNGLNKINSDYILFFLDDMCLINKIKIDKFYKILSVIENENIDFLSFISYKKNWPTLDIDYENYELPNNCIMEINDSFQHLYSVQPCIWKRESLIKILKNNITIGGRDLDSTNIKNLRGQIRSVCKNEFWETNSDFWDYGFKNVCFRFSDLTGVFSFDEHDGKSDYLVLIYSEILRWGKFNFFTHHNNKNFLEKFLQQKGINKNVEKYQKFFN